MILRRKLISEETHDIIQSSNTIIRMIVSIVATIVAITGAWYRLKYEILTLDERITRMEKYIEKRDSR